MSNFYCIECGKQGCVFGYLWVILLVVIGCVAGLFLSLII